MMVSAFGLACESGSVKGGVQWWRLQPLPHLHTPPAVHFTLPLVRKWLEKVVRSRRCAHSCEGIHTNAVTGCRQVQGQGRRVGAVHIHHLRQALRAGALLPTIPEIERCSKPCRSERHPRFLLTQHSLPQCQHARNVCTFHPLRGSHVCRQSRTRRRSEHACPLKPQSRSRLT